MSKKTTAAPAAVTAPISTAPFSKEEEAALVGAAAAVAESDAAQDEAIETYGRIIGKAPTLEMYANAQALFQRGYSSVMPDMSGDALTKRTTRFFSAILSAYGMTKPTSGGVAAQKKAEERAVEKEKILSDFKGVKPEAIKDMIKDAYAKLAAAVPDSAQVKKDLKKAETALRLMTADEQEAFKKQKGALVSSLNEAVKRCTDLKKLMNALKALN
jgi:hypothetical protein